MPLHAQVKSILQFAKKNVMIYAVEKQTVLFFDRRFSYEKTSRLYCCPCNPL